MNRNTKNILLYSIIALIYGTLFTPLIVSGSLFFPYITGKAFTFRIFVELATLLYIVLVVFDRSYIPKKSMILASVLGFTVLLGLATWNAEDPVRSFWSNFERMEGYVTVLHLFCFFVVTASVFRTKQAWYALLNTSLAISIALGFRAFADYDTTRDRAFIVEMFKGIKYFFGSIFGTLPETVRIAGPLGNSSYLGVYSLVHAFIAGLILTTLCGVKKFKEAPTRYVAYILAALFNITVLYNTGTRGSFVGLVAGVFVTVLIPLLLTLFGKSKFRESISDRAKSLVKKISLTALIVILAIVAFLGVNKESDFIKKSNLLNRFSSLITLDIQNVLETQGKARMLLWGMSWRGVQERPLLGWGQDNFPYVFAKYYDPKMYGQEQWFDRTHNVFFDWLIAGGVVGLLSYLILFFALLYMLWKKTVLNKESVMCDVIEKSILTGLLTAYFVHNLFIFDNLASYILFFILLAYVHQRSEVSVAGSTSMASATAGTSTATSKFATITANTSKKIGEFANNPSVQVGIILIAILGFGYVSNNAVYKPLMAGRTLIKALQYSQPEAAKAFGEEATSPKAILGLYKKALAYDTFANTEIRERLAEGTPMLLNGSSDTELITEFTNLVASEYQKAVVETPKDPRPLIFFGLYLQKFGLYQESGLYIDQAIALSPTKQSFLYQKGIVEISTGQYSQAAETFKKAYDLEPSSKESKLLYSLSLIYINKYSEAKTLLSNDLELLTDDRLINILLEKKMYNEILDIAKVKIASDPTNPQSYMSLAALYLKMGRGADAIVQIRKVIELAPEFKVTGEQYIKEIQAGRDPSAPATK